MSEKAKNVTLTRDELGVYTATGVNGATLRFGRGEGLLSPVELLLAAIGGCSAIDVDFVTVKRAEPTAFTVHIDADPMVDANGGHRLTDIGVDFHVTFDDTEEGRAAAAVVDRTITQSRERLCTVSRTVAHETPVAFSHDGVAL